MNGLASVYLIDHKNPIAIIGMVALAASAPLQIEAGIMDNGNLFYRITQVLLPVLSAVLMIVAIVLYGKTRLMVTLLPLTLGVLSFIFKLFIDPRFNELLHHTVCVVLYLLILGLWALTIINKIRTKWLIVIIFAAPFLFHIFLEDLPVILGLAPGLSAAMWLKELSMLCLMFGLSLCGMAFEKK